MKHILRWLAVVLLVLTPATFLTAEKVSELPAPSGYVNDFAGVLSPSVKQKVEALCTQVDRQAHAQIAVRAVVYANDDRGTLLLRMKVLAGDENMDVIARAVRVYAASKADFADCLIECSGSHAQCSHTATFDHNASRSAGMQLIP